MVSQLPEGVVRSPDPPMPVDQAAYAKFVDLIAGAVVDMRYLGTEPVAVAASPNRFDDAHNYDWRALRLGEFFTEKESYLFTRDYEQDLEEAPPEARLLHSILSWLETSNWRDVFADAYGVTWSDQCLAIVLQGGVAWVVFSANNLSEGDPVFAFADDSSLLYFGESVERFDWRIQDSPPLQFLLNTDSD